MEHQSEYAVKEILQGCGEDITRDGLIETPKRYIKFLKEFLNPAPFKLTTFENNEGSDEMVIVKDINFYSLCEHHLVPFFGTGAVAYIPSGNRIVGISKLARTLDNFARNLQNQERITQQVATFLMESLTPKGVAVVLEARHLCMEMRGIQKPGATTTTSAMIGCFKTDINCRQEFLKLIK
jgi:GTP cyclohydrolase IA